MKPVQWNEFEHSRVLSWACINKKSDGVDGQYKHFVVQLNHRIRTVLMDTLYTGVKFRNVELDVNGARARHVAVLSFDHNNVC